MKCLAGLMRFLKWIRNRSHQHLRGILVKSALFFCKLVSSNLILTYDNRDPKDGTGAQLQRILSIFALAKFLNLKYIHAGILDISTHPLDPFQTHRSRMQFVEELNNVFQLDNDEISNPIGITVPVLNIRKLLFYTTYAKIKRHELVLRIVEPYPIVDYCSSVYQYLPDITLKPGGEMEEHSNLIVLHYRYGVGGFAKYHNQSTSRQLDYAFYINALDSIPSQQIEDSRIIMLTDAPLPETIYEPPVDQIHFWINTPNFDGRYMTIEQSEVEDFFANSKYSIEVVRGGDPLEALSVMANARVLVMGKSSLSYVAALLNKNGTIYYPTGFWHTPLRGWISKA